MTKNLDQQWKTKRSDAVDALKTPSNEKSNEQKPTLRPKRCPEKNGFDLRGPTLRPKGGSAVAEVIAHPGDSKSAVRSTKKNGEAKTRLSNGPPNLGCGNNSSARSEGIRQIRPVPRKVAIQRSNQVAIKKQWQKITVAEIVSYFVVGPIPC